MLIQHGLFLVSWWTYPKRSLTKAAQTMQKHALHLASAFATVRRLCTAILTVKRCLAAGCRMNKRKTQPNTYSSVVFWPSRGVLHLARAGCCLANK